MPTDTTQLWQGISDAWDVLEQDGRRGIEGFWKGMNDLVTNVIIDLNRAGIDPHLEFSNPIDLSIWGRFDFSEGTDEIDIYRDILSIPKLQDLLDSPTEEYVEGEHYNPPENGKLEWRIPSPGKILWAPEVKRQNHRVAKYSEDM